MHEILFCEPATFNPNRKSEIFSTKFQVNDEMYEKLLEKPIYFRNNDGNAFLFGPQFPEDTYIKIGDMGNDVAQTGFVDLDKVKVTSYPEDWDLPTWENVLKIRKLYPSILFFGETVGGDVGADLYAHYDTKVK